MTEDPRFIDDIVARVDAIVGASDDMLFARATDLAEEFLLMGETILETWLVAHDKAPTDDEVEGFRLLALHRQGARGDPSFNACRETCREVVFHHNLIRHDPGAADVVRRIRIGAMVVRHLALFIGGKLEVAGLGEFCCSSRPLRQAEYLDPAHTV